MSTVHANGPEEVPARFEALGALAGMPRAAVHAQLREAVRVVVHVTRDGAVRQVRALGVVVPHPGEPGSVQVVRAVSVGPDGLVGGPGRDRLVQLVPEAAAVCRWAPS